MTEAIFWMVPVRVQELGFASLYEPEALAIKDARVRVADEIASRIRMSIRAYSLLRLRPRLLNPFHRPKVTFFRVSHKGLRWIGPVLLLGLFLANLFLAGRPFYAACLGAQLLFYGLGLLGHAAACSGRKRFSAVYFFCLINWCALIGLRRFLRGERKATWETIRTPEFREHGGNTK